MLDFLHKSLVEQGWGEFKKKKQVHVPLVNKNSQNYLFTSYGCLFIFLIYASRIYSSRKKKDK